MNQNNTFVFVAVALIVGLGAGYWWGIQGVKNAEEKIKGLEETIGMFVPPLPEVVNVLGGKITAINGNSFTIEIPSLTDRYPKPGAPLATETKIINLTDDTAFTETNFDPKTFKNGLPQDRTIEASDLRADDIVSVTVAENARAAETLTAVSVHRSSGL